MKDEHIYNCINFFALQAFACFSDLLVEHTEIFWSLFAVDMDAVIVIQPPDTWEVRRNMGCVTTDELFWKLDALQTFISDLHWPDEVFAKHLDQRLKQHSCEMLESLLNRMLAIFQSWEKKGARFGQATDYIIP